MALVVLLRGVNVGGHKRFRPTALARQLAHLDVVSIGAAGSFIVRQPATQARLRAEFSRRLPFDAEMMIVRGREIARMASWNCFAPSAARPGIIRFVSVLSRLPRFTPPIPMDMPSKGTWQLKVLARDGRFVFGLHRRDMKAIGYLSRLDELFGVTVTTRNWNTMAAIGRALGSEVSAHEDPASGPH